LESGYVERLAAGDLETERHFFAHFGRLLRAIVHTRTRGRVVNADDVVQETFARVISALRQNRLRDGDRFGAFVVGICDRVLLEAGRSQTREHPAPDAGDHVPSEDDPEASAASREGLRLAGQVLARLAARDRAILEDLFLHDTDKDEICRRYGVSRDHLRVLVHRAKERFRALADERERKKRPGV
jgi:RNA polymerase sigma-70 factor, ECF subfamily